MCLIIGGTSMIKLPNRVWFKPIPDGDLWVSRPVTEIDEKPRQTIIQSLNLVRSPNIKRNGTDHQQ